MRFLQEYLDDLRGEVYRNIVQIVRTFGHDNKLETDLPPVSWIEDQNETVSMVIDTIRIGEDEEIFFESGGVSVDSSQIPTDELVCDIWDKLLEKYAFPPKVIIPRHKVSKGIPSALRRMKKVKAFPNTETAKKWLDNHGYNVPEFEFVEVERNNEYSFDVITPDGDVLGE